MKISKRISHEGRIAVMKSLPMRILHRIRKNLATHNPMAGWNDFKCDKMDDLYSDVDFEIAARDFLSPKQQ